MLFSSISFIYFFLPLILVLYYLTPIKYRNVTLLLGSLTFYFLGESKYTLLLLLSTLVDYTHSKIIVKHRHTPKAKRALISSIVINLSVLALFKYADFVIVNINTVVGTTIPLLNLDLPLGISFFTFQTMSYTIDVYREEAEVQDNILGLGTYVALFPQLIAGPIVRYKTVSEALKHRLHTFEDFYEGIRRFIIGLSKKVLLANSLGELAEMIYSVKDTSVVFYWMTAVAYALQIYYDFSGYSDMAIGLGKMFGFHFLENFNYPYIARSITEFWRRWHMSLGQWFRDYVYIPLGGNRHKNVRNILIVWFLTGFWHGASWNFVLWGVFFGVMLLLEKFLIKGFLQRHSVLSHIYVMVLITLSFVIFRNTDMKIMLEHFSHMLGISDLSLSSQTTIYYLRSYFTLFVIAFIGATPFMDNGVRYLSEKLPHVKKVVEPIVLIGLLIIVTGYLVDSSFNPFLYFRF